MKEAIYLFFILFLLSGINRAEAQKHGDRVKVEVVLKNNDILHGKMILREVPDELVLYTEEGDSLTFSSVMIKKITIIPAEPYIRKSGSGIKYYNNLSVGLLSGRTNSSSSYRATISAQMVNGLKLKQYLRAGVGISYDQYSNIAVIPIMLSVDGDMLDRTITPFYYFTLGTGPAWRTDDQQTNNEVIDAGLSGHVGAGIRVYSTDGININFSVGYKTQKVEFQEDIWDGSHRIVNRIYKTLALSIGIGI